jgi:hypothetical protein
MDKTTILKIIDEIITNAGSNQIHFVIYSSSKDIFLSNKEYKIEFKDDYVKATSITDGHFEFLGYDAICKVVEIPTTVKTIVDSYRVVC